MDDPPGGWRLRQCAIGVRAGYGGELSYQHSIGSNFAEFDLGLFGHSAAVSGIYDFIIAGNGSFNFYAGPGARIGAWVGKDYSGFDAFGAALGIRYRF